MMLSKYAEFCDSSTITATVANAIIGDVYDTGSAPTLKDLGAGAKPVWLVIQIDDAVTSNGSATVAFTLLSDSTANLATSATTHISTGDIAKATLVAGYTMAFPLPQGNYERYMGLFAETKTQTLNAGTVSAFLTDQPPAWAAYPNGI